MIQGDQYSDLKGWDHTHYGSMMGKPGIGDAG